MTLENKRYFNVVMNTYIIYFPNIYTYTMGRLSLLKLRNKKFTIVFIVLLQNIAN